MACERQIELNLLLFRVKIRFPQKNKTNSYAECENFTLSRSASDWEFHKMHRAGPSKNILTKSQHNISNKCKLEDFYNVPEEIKVIFFFFFYKLLIFVNFNFFQESENYNLPENSTSEAIYELIDTLPMPDRKQDKIKIRKNDDQPRPPLLPRGQSMRAPHPPPRIKRRNQ